MKDFCHGPRARRATQLLAAWLAIQLSLAPVAVAHAQATPATPGGTDAASGGDYEGKFIWGLLLNFAFKFAMQAFGDWLSKKITNDLSDVSTMNRLLLASANAAVVALATQDIFGGKGVGAAENVVVGEPTAPLKVEAGKENFQGFHLAIVGFDREGKPTGLQPVTGGFKSGDRIKLKVISTFDGLLVIDNINPQGQRRQIFPAKDSEAVMLKAGSEILVPMQKDQYFEFAGVQGDEQLVVTLRDPRAVGAAESKATVSRKDERNGSSFVQELQPGTFPVIAQSIKLRHGN